MNRVNGTTSATLTLLLATAASAQAPLSAGFTYQGYFKQNGTAYTGPADMIFALWDDPTNTDPGHLVGSQFVPVQVNNGLFTVTLNASDEFGPAAFNGSARWLEIQAAVPNDTSPFVTLTPRQLVTASPYALQTRGIAVDDAGRVGLGTSFPAAWLHIAANSSVNDLPLLTFAEDSVDDSFSFRGDFLGANSAGNFLRLRSLWNSNVMTWRGDGLVGIGTSSPVSALHVAPPSGVTIGVNPSSGGHTAMLLDLTAPTNGAGRIQGVKSSGSLWGDVVMNPFGGNVGIGTASPASKLSVNGAMDVTGNVGIGTASPQSALHIKRGGPGNPQNAALTLDCGPTSSSMINFYDVGAATWSIGKNAAYKFVIEADQLGPRMLIDALTGNVGIGTTTPAQKLDVNGTTRTKVLEITGGSDVAEPYDIAPAGGAAPRPGMVVAIDPQQVGRMRVAASAYDRTVAGIISGANGINPGLMLTQQGTVADGALPVATVGRVWCWVDADAGGPVEAGDLLTSSDTPGHAMKVTDPVRSQGAVIGKAMSALERGKGLVLVLVALQ